MADLYPIITKAIEVLHSCQTIGQFETASKYIDLVYKQIKQNTIWETYYISRLEFHRGYVKREVLYKTGKQLALGFKE